ncbi:MAG: hypothetical protein LBH14_03630 [Desulfobulbaceae bacterium]|jgi:hypothetical protein|nr:hypothetical protein [Desulfobulbaceae bacterium]
MKIKGNYNKTAIKLQGNSRVDDLRCWMYLHNVKVGDFSRACGVSDTSINVFIRKSRMPVRHHRAICEAFPDLPIELLPEPIDIPTGPKPKGLSEFLAGQSA